ncbi:flagellar biosynthetic protein FliO [Endozoicomonadaceae bacterium StTr2]
MEPAFSATSLALKTGGMLVVVIALILILAWLSRRANIPGMNNTRRMKVIDTLMLGRNERICLIQVGDSYQLIGIAAGRITPLAQLDKLPEPVDNSTEAPFSKILEQISGSGLIKKKVSASSGLQDSPATSTR